MKVSANTPAVEGKKRIGRPPKVKVNGKRTTILISTLQDLRARSDAFDKLRDLSQSLAEKRDAQQKEIGELRDQVDDLNNELVEANAELAKYKDSASNDVAALWALKAVPDLMEIIGTLHLNLLRAQRQG
jgi:uncharacterized coiled-coil DUF342 family protein